MLWMVFAAHGAGIVLAVAAGRQSMRSGLVAASLAPITTTLWAVSTLVRDRPTDDWEFAWVDGLDLTLRFRADALGLLMVLLVSGIGALVFWYATGYFSADADGASRFPATLLAFSASMLGLVLADSIWTLFIFWEFTSVTSFLLVGHKHVDPQVRAAARRALVITGSGGLALLAGLIVLADAAGSTTLTELKPISGPQAAAAGVLILIGAATKSAQVPFHVWLPGAMAAPTPVSAYLHSATMVKAGVLLIAVTGPAFADVTTWKVVGLTFGISSMLWGAIGALRHRDAKLILAWGTVSQLGLLVTLLALGNPKATFAAVSMLFSHALFKAALFLVVGEIDIRTGTRDITELGGLAKKMPMAAAVALAGGLSMMGAPPLVGFMAKEAAIEAVLGLSGIEQVVALGSVVGGSVLTVAYTARFLLSVFGPGPNTLVAPPRLAMSVPSLFLAVAALAGFVFVGQTNSIVGAASVELDPASSAYVLIQWPGLKVAFLISMAVLGAGSLLGLVLARGEAPAVPAPFGAITIDSLIDGVLDGSPRVISRIQHGSLPVYLATMGIAASLAATPFASALSFDHIVAWDHPVQGALAAAIVATALAGAFVGSRLGAALTLGAVGIGVAGLFLVHGAPDLVLTQLLVETIIVVGFVLGLGHLARRFPEVSDSWRNVRICLSIAGGLAVMTALAAAGSAPSGQAPVAELAERSVSEGGGKNIVNVILTDMRALDTLGEVVVLATVAVGMLALARSGKPEVAP